MDINTDISIQKKSLAAFAQIKGLDYKKLGHQDVGYKLISINNITQGYAEVCITNQNIKNAFPLKILARKLVKLIDKRLNAVIIWGCQDGILYINPTKIKGEAEWCPKNEDLIITFTNKKEFKYVRF